MTREQGRIENFFRLTSEIKEEVRMSICGKKEPNRKTAHQYVMQMSEKLEINQLYEVVDILCDNGIDWTKADPHTHSEVAFLLLEVFAPEDMENNRRKELMLGIIEKLWD